jgi:hypothetical protein
MIVPKYMMILLLFSLSLALLYITYRKSYTLIRLLNLMLLIF